MTTTTHNHPKVTCVWPNGSTIVGYLVANDDGSQSIVFGPEGQFSIMYVAGEGHPDFPPGVTPLFATATLTPMEPEGLGAVITATVKGVNEQPRTLIRVAVMDSVGGWYDAVHNSWFKWYELNRDTITIHSDGVVL